MNIQSTVHHVWVYNVSAHEKIPFSFSYNYNCNCHYKNYNYSWDIWRWSKFEAQFGASNCLFEAVKTPACLCRFFRKRPHSLFSACKGEENQEEKKQREMTTRYRDLERLKPIQDPDKNIKNIITKGRGSNSSSESASKTLSWKEMALNFPRLRKWQCLRVLPSA